MALSYFLCCFMIGCTNKAKQENNGSYVHDSIITETKAIPNATLNNEKDTTSSPIIIIEEPKSHPQDTGVVEIEYIPPVNVISSSKETAPSLKWAYLIDENEGVVRKYCNRNNNQLCREKSDDITIISTSIFKGKAYISIVSPKFGLTYDEADFYREDKQGNLHKILKSEYIDKIPIALVVEKGKATEIEVDFPKECPTGDYLLRIKVHNEQEEHYEIYQWFEAYTSKRVSRREKPVELEPLLAADCNGIETEDDVYPVAQNMPEFPGGGMPQLMEFLQDNLQYNKVRNGNGIKKRVIIQVIIDKDGSVTQPVILRGVNPVLDKEALRVVNLMPKWKPGRQRGVPVKVKFAFPVIFDSPAD